MQGDTSRNDNSSVGCWPLMRADSTPTYVNNHLDSFAWQTAIATKQSLLRNDESKSKGSIPGFYVYASSGLCAPWSLPCLSRVWHGLSRVCSRVRSAQNPMFTGLVTGVTGKTPPGPPDHQDHSHASVIRLWILTTVPPWQLRILLNRTEPLRI